MNQQRAVEGSRLRVSAATEDVLSREGEAPAEPRRDDSVTIVSTRSLAEADPRDPIEMRGPRLLRVRLGGSLALPFGAETQGASFRTDSPKSVGNPAVNDENQANDQTCGRKRSQAGVIHRLGSGTFFGGKR